MELRHLRYFVAVAEELNFRRAAERLAMAQPPLSQQIQDLEEELGVLLFSRSRRNVELTVEGRVFLADVRQILAQVDSAVHRVKRAHLGELGQLTIGYTSLIHNPLFPEVLRVYRERFPEVEISLRDLVTIEQMQQLTVNRLDSSFATHAAVVITAVEQEHLLQEPIWHEPMVALLAKNHALAARSAITLADLAHEDWIWFARPFDPITYDYMMQLFKQVGFLPNVTQEINQQQIILSLVAAGFGVSIAPKSVAKMGEVAGVAHVDLVDPTPVVEYNIVWRRTDTSPILQTFLNVVREVAREFHH